MALIDLSSSDDEVKPTIPVKKEPIPKREPGAGMQTEVSATNRIATNAPTDKDSYIYGSEAYQNLVSKQREQAKLEKQLELLTHQLVLCKEQVKLAKIRWDLERPPGVFKTEPRERTASIKPGTPQPMARVKDESQPAERQKTATAEFAREESAPSAMPAASAASASSSAGISAKNATDSTLASSRAKEPTPRGHAPVARMAVMPAPLAPSGLQDIPVLDMPAPGISEKDSDILMDDFLPLPDAETIESYPTPGESASTNTSPRDTPSTPQNEESGAARARRPTPSTRGGKRPSIARNSPGVTKSAPKPPKMVPTRGKGWKPFQEMHATKMVPTRGKSWNPSQGMRATRAKRAGRTVKEMSGSVNDNVEDVNTASGSNRNGDNNAAPANESLKQRIRQRKTTTSYTEPAIDIEDSAGEAVKRRKRQRRTVIDSDDEEEYVPGQKKGSRAQRQSAAPTSTSRRSSATRKSPSNASKEPESAPKAIPAPQSSAATDIKAEPRDDDDDDLYSLPEPRISAIPEAEEPRSVSRSSTESAVDRQLASEQEAGRREIIDSDSELEMWHPRPKPFKVPTAFNEAIANSAEWDRKPYANELVSTWPKVYIPDAIFPSQMFSRRFLSNVLGGSEQEIRCNPSDKKRARQKDLFGKVICGFYACEKSDWNPHMPAAMGHHGLVYFAGHESEFNNDGDSEIVSHAHNYNDALLPVFCRRAANNWEYCGDYLLTNRKFVDGEYESIPECTKKVWSEWYSGAGKWKRTKSGLESLRRLGLVGPEEEVTPEDVRQMLDSGRLKMEAVTYECRAFNREMYLALVRELEKWRERGDVQIKREESDDE